MTRSRLFERTALSAMLILAFQACSTTRAPSVRTPPTASHRDSLASESQISSWTPQLRLGERRYLIHDSSTVSLSNDTTARILPIESTMIYSISIADSNNALILTGRIDSLRVNTDPLTKVRTDTSKAVELHAIISRNGHFLIGERLDKDCITTNPSAASRIGELLIVLPPRAIKVGEKWSDSSSTTVCYGKIPLTQMAAREYELLNLTSCQQHDGVEVRRVVSNVLTGSSTNQNNHLTASGSGTASSMLCLQRDTGALLESNTQSHLNLNITTSRGIFPFTQNTSTHIELR